MKKTLLLTAIACFAAISSNAQFEFTLVGTSTVVTGTTHSVNISNTDVLHLDVDVKNISGTTLNTIVSRKIITAPGAAWLEQVCYGTSTTGGCFDINFATSEWVSSGTVQLAPNDTGLMNIKITPDPISGAPMLARYYIGTVGNPFMDSIDFAITSVLAVKDIKKGISLSVSPNPASENVMIKVSNLEKGNYKIVDVLGNIVASESFSGSRNVDVSDFRNGVYFIVISGEGIKSINRKLVVKH